jgi:hypothetical protein
MTWDAAVMLNWNCCALGVAANAVGIPASEDGSVLGLRDRRRSIPLEWPWLKESYDNTNYMMYISNSFEFYGLSIPSLVEFIRSVEPDCGECNNFQCTCVGLRIQEMPAAVQKPLVLVDQWANENVE